ncbi:hypothetical protein Poly51_18640 [Rubripirellula tenax]|uniref:Uncharacterized protein n=1 Tax=Rubripirellula tenax TaxID=2528015 RepID=A0A5C6FCA0_9BACT|nr:hypothetical protein Poly51_18640 [Rubripirellula tenax]
MCSQKDVGKGVIPMLFPDLLQIPFWHLFGISAEVPTNAAPKTRCFSNLLHRHVSKNGLLNAKRGQNWCPNVCHLKNREAWSKNSKCIYWAPELTAWCEASFDTQSMSFAGAERVRFQTTCLGFCIPRNGPATLH